MITEFFYITNIYLFSRLIFLFRDEPVSKSGFLLMLFFQISGLIVLKMNFWILLVILVFLLIDFGQYLIENKIGKTELVRLSSLFISVIILSLIFVFTTKIEFHPFISDVYQKYSSFSFFYLLSKTGFQKLNILFIGLFLVTNEVNNFIRFLLKNINQTPIKKDSNNNEQDIIDIKEFNAGRIIGILERILVYFFVLETQYTALGFILAAKSFARYKKITENQEFAEYVLIGTLLSIVLAFLVALIVNSVLR